MEVISSIYNSGYNIKKFYLGSQELKLAYLGEQIVFNEVIDDLNYVLYEFYKGKTISNTIEAPVKRAILKGQTLVNLNHPTSKGEYRILDEERWQTLTVWSSDYNTWSVEECAGYKPNTKYFAIVEVVENTLTNLFYGMAGSSNSTMFAGDVETLTFEPGETGVKRGMFTSRADFTNVTRGARSSTETNGTVGTHIKFRIMVVEYQEGMEYWDIPFFEGIKSVKMPVLKTTRKNLYPHGDVNFISAYTSWHDALGGTNMYGSYVPKSKAKFMLKAGKYTLSFGEANNFKTLQLITMDEKIIRNGVGSFELTDDTYVVLRGIVSTSNEISSLKNIQIEQDTQATTYEPYKSNILTVNEDVELRGIGEVKDELDLLTGELAQRIGKVVLDGSEKWLGSTVGSSGTFMRFYITVQDSCLNEGGSDILCDKFASIPHDYWDTDIEGIHSKKTVIHINIPTSKLESNDISGFKKWLSSNPVTVYYRLATESVKTVDLTMVDQDEQTISKLNSFNGTTHVSTEVAENSIYPTIAIEVATE